MIAADHGLNVRIGITKGVARIRSGQSTHALVGGAYHTESRDFLLTFELGQYLHQGAWKPLWQRANEPGGGLILGSGSAFLVFEERDHAQSRGATIYAAIDEVVSGQARREADSYAEVLSRLTEVLMAAGRPDLIVSGASGANLATQAERSLLDSIDTGCERALSAVFGHLKEAQFPFAVALAALAIHQNRAFPVFSPETETDYDGPVSTAIATAVGYHRAEGAARLSKA